MEVFSSNSCILSGNCVPSRLPGTEQCMKRKMSAVLVPSTRDQKLPLKTSDSLVLSSKERTKENPNPVKQWATFSYSLPSAENAAVIYITDVSGKSIVKLPVNGKQGKKPRDTRDVDAGVYIYTLKAAGMSKSGKIIISK